MMTFNDSEGFVDLGTATQAEKEAWIVALESGEYEQVQGTLKGKTESGTVGFCCLGVYCDVKGTRVKTAVFDISDGVFVGQGAQVHYLMVEKKLGEFVDTGIDMNDEGKSFIDIAAAARDFYGIYDEKEH
tara:strand:- start:289 stop:678 length:390 start_codon:yes stop_codon:yes gene_type:complete